MRTFQFSDAKSHKFWQIEVSGSAFTVTFGKVGTAGQTQTKSFPTPAAAQAAADKLIKEKTGKGYKETTPAASTSASSDAAALERGILEHRDEFVRWAVYSDYLTEQGDPRGEFMRVQLDLEDETLSAADRTKLRRQERSLLADHQEAWLGPLAEFTVNCDSVDVYTSAGMVKRSPVAHTFERGWLASLDFAELTVPEARAFAACQDARLVRDVIVRQVAVEAREGETPQYVDSHYPPGPDVPADVDPYEGPSLHALCRCPHLATVRSLCLGERIEVGPNAYFRSEINGQLAHHLVKQMQLLETLEVYASHVEMDELFVLPMPALKTLVLFHNYEHPLEKLAKNKTLTKLATLRCHPHAHRYHGVPYIGLKQLRAICRSPHLTSLSHLCLRLTDFGDKGVKEIVQSGLLKQLRVLDLYGGCISDEGAELLAGCPDFKSLEFLDLRKNALTETGIRLLKATKVKVDASEQHTSTKVDFENGEVPEYLYDGDIE